MADKSENQIHYILDKNGKQIAARSLVLNGISLNFPANFVNFPMLFEALPSFHSRSDDVWLCSYPKAGCNWLAEMVVQVLKGHPTSNNKVSFMFEMCHSINEFDGLPSPRVMNTHVPWKNLPPQIKKSKIIVVLRNPLSIALSWFHHIKALYGYEGTAQDFIESFAGEIYSFYGSWFEHTKGFYNASKQHGNILVLFYEEMRQDPHTAISDLSTFLDVSLTKERMTEIVDQTSMRSMKQHFKHDHADVALQHKTKSHIFIRKGEIAEWKNHVTEEFVEEFMRSYRTELADCPELLERIVL